VIAKEGNEEFRRPVLKDKTQRSIAPAFKKILAQFAYPETAMRAAARIPRQDHRGRNGALFNTDARFSAGSHNENTHLYRPSTAN
jgi:hypothetical protein